MKKSRVVKRNRNRKTKRGGMWSWFKPKPAEPIEEDITEEEANRIALQIKQNTPLTRDVTPIPKGKSIELYTGKNPKKIKLALTKILPFQPRDKDKFDFYYYMFERTDPDGPNERLRLFNADMEADEIIDYVQNGVRLDGIRYILSRSQNSMKLESALKKKVDMLDQELQKKFADILINLKSIIVDKADEKILRGTRWVE